MRKKYIIGGIIIVAFTVWAGISFKSTLTPYVSIAEAKQSGKMVQVKGERLDNGYFDTAKNLFTFEIKDEQGEILKVTYDGAKPGNFDQATHVVCVGKYAGGVFVAKELLIKCPSKYQEEGTPV
ncbi:MAG: cytochrome c maturation protein CcmE [Calditrichaceae bacterium]|nr:cytochrome c maturation protein CcmE [Calditrichaceae bacterium]HES60279.1 cytochrome c maturation protein CcmE [Caldithrix sp.]